MFEPLRNRTIDRCMTVVQPNRNDKPMKKSIVTAIIVAASTVTSIVACAPDPSSPDESTTTPIVADTFNDPNHPDYINTDQGIEEDDIEWVCETMGNQLCGPGPYETLTVDGAIDRCYLTTTTIEDELACIEYVIPLFGHEIATSE